MDLRAPLASPRQVQDASSSYLQYYLQTTYYLQVLERQVLCVEMVLDAMLVDALVFGARSRDVLMEWGSFGDREKVGVGIGKEIGIGVWVSGSGSGSSGWGLGGSDSPNQNIGYDPLAPTRS